MRVVLSASLALLSLSMGISAGGAPVSDTNLSPSPRIVGGDTSPIESTPWQVALIYFDPDAPPSEAYFQFCGGSILNSTWIATAAHCLEDWPAEYVSQLKILARTNDLDEAATSSITARRIVIHPQWNTSNSHNDIALVQLSSPIVLEPGVAEAISLPLSKPVQGASAVISGWGTTYFGAGEGTQLLQKAQVQIFSDSYCRNSAVYGRSYSSDRMLCASGVGFSADTCQGDSGGPLAINVGGRWELHGITSFGTGCAQAPFPGVYAEVYNYRSWLNEQMLPQIRSISPSSARVGNSVSVVGSRFEDVLAVKVGTINTVFQNPSSSLITFVVPEGATSSQIRVETRAGSATSSQRLNVLGSAPTEGDPRITSFSPTSVRIGGTVTINGRNLAGTLRVTVNDIEQVVTEVSPTKIRFTVAPGTTRGRVIVTTSGEILTSTNDLRIRTR